MTLLEWLGLSAAIIGGLTFAGTVLAWVLRLQKAFVNLEARIAKLEEPDRLNRIEAMYQGLDRDLKKLGEQMERLTLVLVHFASGKELDLTNLLQK